MAGKHYGIEEIVTAAAVVSLDGRRPAPLTKASGIVGLVATVITAVVALGILPAADGDAVNTAANYLIPAGFAAFAVLHTLVVHFTAKAKTTPMNDPRAAVLQPDGSTVLEPMVALSLATNPYPTEPPPAAGVQQPDDFADVA